MVFAVEKAETLLRKEKLLGDMVMEDVIALFFFFWFFMMMVMVAVATS